MGDIRPYDHDAGVSFLVDSATSQAFTELDTRKSGIRIEAGIKELRFNNVSVDLIPWRAENTSNGVTTKVILHKAYSQVDVLLREKAFWRDITTNCSLSHSRGLCHPSKLISMVLVCQFLIRLLVY